jgi:hypothetical protein
LDKAIWSMTSTIEDIHKTLEYAHSHGNARRLLVAGFFALAMGTLVVISSEGWKTDSKAMLLGTVAVAGAIAALAYAVHTLRQPSRPNIVLSPDGVLCLDVSDKPIPWHEILDVGRADLSRSGVHFYTKVTELQVSRSFFESLELGTTPDYLIAVKGSRSNGNRDVVYVAYHQWLPRDEFHEAVLARWKSYHGRRAEHDGDDRIN